MAAQMLGKYSVHETLSKGNFSRVRYCVDTTTNTPYALRIIDRQKVEENGLLENLRNEITMMKMFEHRSVVSVINMMASTNRVFLVLDVMLGGNMKTKLFHEQFLDEKEAIFYFLQLFSGVEYLHSMGVTHGNLRLENILLHTNGILKITDFSMSTILDIQDTEVTDGTDSTAEDKEDLLSTVSTKCFSVQAKTALLKHSLQYLAPEVVDDCSQDTKKADLWSMGVILFAMTAGFLPFGGALEKKSDPTSKSLNPIVSSVLPQSNERGDSNISKETMERIRCGDKKMYPDWLSKSLKSLIDGILIINPMERFTLYDIRSSAWMYDAPQNMEMLLEKMEKDVIPRSTSRRRAKTQNKPASNSIFDCFCQPYYAFVDQPNGNNELDSTSDEDYSYDSNDDKDKDKSQDEYNDESITPGSSASDVDDRVQYRSSSSSSPSLSTNTNNLNPQNQNLDRNKSRNKGRGKGRDRDGTNLDSSTNSSPRFGSQGR